MTKQVTEPFMTVLADPGWRYTDKLRTSATKRSSTDQYKTTMTVEEICALYKPALCTPGGPITCGVLCGYPINPYVGFLWLWTTNAMLLDGSATAVCHAWGFTPKQIITWIKMSKTFAVQLGMGRYTRGATEHLILATRGKAASLVQTHGETNVIFAPRLAHSQKPDVVYALIEAVSPGPYLELFARGERPGWTSYGDELPATAAVGIVLPDPGLEWP